MTGRTFQGSEGAIFYRRWEPPAPPRHIVLIVHGYAEHGGRYQHVAEALGEHGAVVYAPDHIGHGRSEGPRALITDFDHVVADLVTLLQRAISEHPRLPVVLVGHSMGGLLAARVGERRPDLVQGIAFCGAVLGDWEWARRVLAMDEIPETEFDPGALSRDLSVGLDYAADPLVYHGQYQRPLLDAEVVALDAFQGEREALTMPILMLHGSRDPFVPFERTVQAVDSLPTDDLTVRIVEGGRHEVLNERNRDEVIGYLAAWIERVVMQSPPPPG